jgi:hypothetical protein
MQTDARQADSTDYGMPMRFRQTAPLRRAIAPAILLISFALLAGCAAPTSFLHDSRVSDAGGIVVRTNDRSTFTFRDDGWSLTARGISGFADISTDGGGALQKDTTLSYADVASAAPSDGRSGTMRQFLLTILGVVLVIGLAALILYAAFPATDR